MLVEAMQRCGIQAVDAADGYVTDKHGYFAAGADAANAREREYPRILIRYRREHDQTKLSERLMAFAVMYLEPYNIEYVLTQVNGFYALELSNEDALTFLVRLRTSESNIWHIQSRDPQLLAPLAQVPHSTISPLAPEQSMVVSEVKEFLDALIFARRTIHTDKPQNVRLLRVDGQLEDIISGLEAKLRLLGVDV